MDQDVINVLLNGKIDYLPPQYGINNTQRDYKNYYRYCPSFNKNEILIEHMAFKPWQPKKITNFLLSNNNLSNKNRKE
jgi:lipopolysaccharide biosynthesis glycosyltransferase